MLKTYSKPNKEWAGFRPISYSIHNGWELPLNVIEEDGAQKKARAMTVGALATELSKQQIEKIESGMTTEISTATGTTEVDGLSFNRSIAEAMLRLQADGINYLYTQWFWFDQDHVTDDMMRSYSFFVVHNDAIVCERVTFCDYGDSGFDPAVFQANEDRQPIWRSHPELDAASVRYWYRKFYTETKT